MDVARGVTVALMLYVNNADDGRPWWQPHAVWNGLHLADVVMPAFLVSTAGHIQTAQRNAVRRSLAARLAEIALRLETSR